MNTSFETNYVGTPAVVTEPMSPHQVARMDTIGVYRSVLVPNLTVPISQVADHRSGTGNKIQRQLGGHRFQRGLRVTFNTPL